MEPAENTSIFFLEDEAVLFHEPAQALYRLNTSAAFIWCLLEEGCDSEAILTKLVSTFNLSDETAREYYRESEQTFSELCVIRGTEKPPVLPPDSLETADRITYREDQFLLESRYSLLSSRIRVRYSDPAQKSLVNPVLGHLAALPSTKPTTTFDILEDDTGRITVCRDKVPMHYCDNLNQLAPAVKGLIWQTAINAHEFFLDIHAGVVSDGKHCFILPASPGSGKSSLTLALTYHGFEFFSDEVALLHKEDFQVESVPLAACIKHTGIDLIAQYFPQLADITQHHRSDGKYVRYLQPPIQSTPPQGTKRPVGAIIFPQYDPSAETALTPLNKSDAVLNLIKECVVIDKRLERDSVKILLDWIEKTPCYRLISTNLEEAVQYVKQVSTGISKT